MSKANEFLKLVEGSIQVGDRVKVDLKNTKIIPQQVKILKQMIKDGGDGKVLIHSIKDSSAEVSGWEKDSILGTVTVPLSALRK